MISIEDAIALSYANFPNGPEILASRLNVSIRQSERVGGDGYCLAYNNRAIIRINSLRSPNSRRFTLAHELGHLLLGIPSIVGESVGDMLASNSAEERRVNDVAAELLLPKRVVAESVASPPIAARAIEQLAKKANISQLAAVLRICNLAKNIGLENAAVAQFQRDELVWIRTDTLRVPGSAMPGFLKAARKTHPRPYRRKQSDGKVAVASLIDNPRFESSTLFLQLLPVEVALQVSPHERRLQIEAELFKNDIDFQRSLQGCFGAFRPHVAGLSLDQAVKEFWSRYDGRFPRLKSSLGREYVKLRLSDWCMG